MDIIERATALTINAKNNIGIAIECIDTGKMTRQECYARNLLKDAYESIQKAQRALEDVGF